jgi:hypothetical protein
MRHLKKGVIMRNFYFVLVMILCSVVCLFSQEGKVNFSGNWTIDENKSDFGEGGGRFYSTKLVVKQESNLINIERTGQGRDGEFTWTDEITLDGKENELEGFGGSTRKVTAKWTDNGKILNISSFMVFEREGNTFEINTSENWGLTEKNVLSIASTMSSPRGERSSKLVYNKAE